MRRILLARRYSLGVPRPCPPSKHVELLVVLGGARILVAPCSGLAV